MSEEIAPLNEHRLRKGHPMYDKAAQIELDQQVANWKAGKTAGDRSRFEEAWALQVVKDRKLHIQDGFGDFHRWAEVKLGIPHATLDRRLLLAGTYSKAFVVKHGDGKVRLSIEYANRTLAEDDATDVESLVFVVPQADGRTKDIPFSDAKEADIAAALSHQRSLAKTRAAHELAPHQREKLAVVNEVLMLPGEERSLGTFSGRRAASGLEEDAMLRLDFRYGDLDAVLERLARLHAAPPRRSRGR